MGDGRGRASAADSPQPRAEPCARAPPGTPRHVIAPAGATQEAGPARETGVGREVAPGSSRHRPRHGMQDSPSARGDLTPQSRTFPRAGEHGPATRRGYYPSLPLAVASRTDAGEVTRHPAHAGAGTKPALTPHSSGKRSRVLPGRSPFVVGTRPYEWPPARAGAWGPASAAPAPPPPRSPWPPGQGRGQGRALRPRGAAPRLQPLASKRSPLGLRRAPIGRRGPAE